ncbi:MAG TPA: hypothetical protein VF662_06225 [Allosphingosinicella sp.]|jgi:hypothetical protein
MMARGFKPVGWVAGVAAAALACYMLSLNVAAERAELKKLEWRIVMAKRDIRTLQTELGTRGRLQQLENWNAHVLALSAPAANQFVDSEMTLARFDRTERPVADRVQVQMASADVAPAPASKIAAPVQLASAPAPAAREPSLVHQASIVLPEEKPLVGVPAQPKLAAKAEVKPAPEPRKKLAEAKPAAAPAKKLADAAPVAKTAKKKPALIDNDLVADIRAAAKAETKGSSAGR